MVAFVVLTMAIGIASCMTALAIFDALEGEPLPGISDSLYVVTMDSREAVSGKSAGDEEPDSLLKWRDARALIDARPSVMHTVLAYTSPTVSVADGSHAELVTGLMAYGPALQTLGVTLSSGRPWSAAELASRTPVAVIDSNLAMKLFGKTKVVGNSVKINQRMFRVIGVSAPWEPRAQFIDTAPNAALGWDTQLFIPLGAALDAGVGPMMSGECGTGAANMTYGAVDIEHCRWLEAWAFLPTADRVEIYARFVAGYAEAQHDAGRFINPPNAKLYATQRWMTLNQVVPADVSLNLLLAGAFLLLCMISVTGLMTARFLRRRTDVAIRRALGASWRQVFAQHVVESGLFGLMGGMLALPLTLLGMWIVRMQPVSYAPAAQFSLGVFVALLILALLVGTVVGVLPAWRVCRLSPATQIHQD